MVIEQDRILSETLDRHGLRLRRFIRSRVADAAEADDVLQEVFYELVDAVRMLRPVEQVGAWLFAVARNRITDLFRRRKLQSLSDPVTSDDGDDVLLEELLSSDGESPEHAYARAVLLDELEEALAELPEEQRAAFVGHVLEGRSFREMADETGVSINTLLSRKRYAVLYLRGRLQNIYDEFVTR